jgi:hypothetical protein
MPAATAVVFQSDAARLDYDAARDYYSLQAARDIATGTILLLEHVLSYPSENAHRYLINALERDDELRDSLYPRTSKAKQGQHIVDKIGKNVFSFNGETVLGNVFSKINHSCRANCHMGNGDYVNGDRVYALIAIRSVKAGEELTISYAKTNKVDYHDRIKTAHGFECDCTPEYIMQHDVRHRIIDVFEEEFLRKRQEWIQEKVDGYMERRGGVAVSKHQQLIKRTAKRIQIAYV